MSSDDRATLYLCAPCLAGGAETAARSLQDALSAAQLPVGVAIGNCLGACEAPVVLALQGPGRGVYVFAGVDPAGDRSDIVATCHAFLDSPGGWIVDARPCGRLRFCLRTRVPAATGP